MTLIRTRRRLLMMAVGGGLSSLVGAVPAFAFGGTTDDTDAAPDPLQSAFDQLGKPYIWGSAAGRSYFGPDPAGFDCSGFAAWWSAQNGVSLPASTAAAWRVTVPTDDPQPGDYAFYNMGNPSPRIQHMAIVVGDGQIIQAGGRRSNVNVDSAWAIGTPSFRKLA
jgi:cell wall-associated NlpC family hydrolase